MKLHIGSIRNNKDSAKLVRTSLETMQLEPGLGTSLMDKYTTTPFGIWIEATLNNSIQDFLSSCDAKLMYSNLWCPKKQRKGDTFLMHEIYQKYKDNNRLLKQMNRCRVAVQVIILADISDSEGKEIMSNIMIGKKPVNRRSKLDWSIMGTIKLKYWK